MKKSLFFGCAVFAMALTLAACNTSIEQNELLAQATIQHATGKVIEAGPDPVQRAARVFDIATQARGLLNNESVSLPGLEAAVRDSLTTANLTPADLVLVDTLVRVITFELARQVGSDKLNADQKLVVDKVLSWVIAAATITQPATT